MIDLQTFKYGWKDKKCLKSYFSKLNKRDYFVFEHFTEELRVREISDEWLSCRQNSHELRFMARAFKGIKQPNRKVLYLDRTQPEKRLTFLKYRNTRADAIPGRTNRCRATRAAQRCRRSRWLHGRRQ